MLVSQTQYLAGQPGKKRRHCTTLITHISLGSAVIQMQGNHLTRQAEGHPMQHHGNSLKLLQGNMSPTIEPDQDPLTNKGKPISLKIKGPMSG